MPLPTYDQFVWPPSTDHPQGQAQLHQALDAYRAKNSRTPGDGDIAHLAWRLLVEGWTIRDVLHDIKGEPLEDGGIGGAFPPRQAR